MLNISQVIKTVVMALKYSPPYFVGGITTEDHYKPLYNQSAGAAPKICKLNHEACKRFYKDVEAASFVEKRCPFGFTVSKRSFEISTRLKQISLFSLTKYSK